ncbi:MAG: hypothetical protein WC314_04440 [Vulcanimicrobiota bacterium]
MDDPVERWLELWERPSPGSLPHANKLAAMRGLAALGADAHPALNRLCDALRSPSTERALLKPCLSAIAGIGPGAVAATPAVLELFWSEVEAQHDFTQPDLDLPLMECIQDCLKSIDAEAEATRLWLKSRQAEIGRLPLPPATLHYLLDFLGVRVPKDSLH